MGQDPFFDVSFLSVSLDCCKRVQRLSMIIIRYTDKMNFAVYMDVLFITFFPYSSVSICIFVCFMLPLNCIN
jgi:hypothetical protein